MLQISYIVLRPPPWEEDRTDVEMDIKCVYLESVQAKGMHTTAMQTYVCNRIYR